MTAALGVRLARSGSATSSIATSKSPRANGGEELDLGVLYRAGVDVRGRLVGFAGRHALFGDGLGDDVARAETRMRRILGRIDERVAQDGLDLPEGDVHAVSLPARLGALDLGVERIGTVLWATGYRRAYPWLEVPVLDTDGEILQRHGITPAHGLYTLGLKFQRRRRSHFIGGVGADAAFLARIIVDRAAAGRRLAA